MQVELHGELCVVGPGFIATGEAILEDAPHDRPHSHGAARNLRGELRAEVARGSPQLVRSSWKTFQMIALIAKGPFAISAASFELKSPAAG